MRLFRCLAVYTCLTALIVAATSAQLRGEDWPCWRGPRGDGTSQATAAPQHWNAANNSAQHVKWKVDVPGRGHASPIVFGNKIFTVSCDEDARERLLLCYERNTGKELWRQVVLKSPLEKKHGLNSFASSTPATDGKRVYLAFLEADKSDPQKSTPGMMVVAAYDLDGKQQWLVRPGPFNSVHGFCTCPLLFEDQVIVNGDHDGDSYIAALNRDTGETVWKIPREHHTRSYATPIIREIDGRLQMILAGDKCVASYDPRSGARNWIIDGPTEQYVASMVYDGSLLFMTAGFPEHHLLAIKPNGAGNVTHSAIVWRTTQATSYVPSPIVSGKYLLLTSDEGIGSCFVAATGERLWKERLGRHYSGSPVLIKDLVYFTSDDGVTKIIRPGEKLEIVATNALDENCYSSPAVSDGQLFFRGEKHLICFSDQD